MKVGMEMEMKRKRAGGRGLRSSPPRLGGRGWGAGGVKVFSQACLAHLIEAAARRRVGRGPQPRSNDKMFTFKLALWACADLKISASKNFVKIGVTLGPDSSDTLDPFKL